VTVEGASWRVDQLKGELVEYISDRTINKRNSPNGEVKTVESSRRTSLTVTGKNECGQVAGRTTEYGSLDEDEYAASSEKYDPTHYTRVTLRRPWIVARPTAPTMRSAVTG
jgi:hypothetical protein